MILKSSFSAANLPVSAPDQQDEPGEAVPGYPPPADHPQVLEHPEHGHHCQHRDNISASKSSIRRFVITEKAPTRALTLRSLNVKFGPQCKGHKGRRVG